MLLGKQSLVVMLILGGLFSCPDNDGDGVANQDDNCIEVSNAGQGDQDLDTEGDACDPASYDFELDAPGLRPVGVTQDGADEPSFVVRDYSGDRGVSYDAGTAGVHDRFDRLPSWRQRQDYDLYVDTVDLAGEALTLEIWSDGTTVEDAGSGVQIRLDTTGQLVLRMRNGTVLTELGQATLRTTRLRFRLRDQLGVQARIFVDTWNGGGWDQQLETLIADDRTLFGRGVALVQLDGGRRPVVRVTGNPIAPQAVLSIDRTEETLTDWKLFQRGPDGDAPIPVHFSYRTPSSVRLEARVVDSATSVPLAGFDFPNLRWNLPAAANGATTEVVIDDVPQGGNYDVELRLVRIADGVVLGQDSAGSIAVGDVFIAGGQSNMSGHSVTLDPVEAPVPEVHLFGNDYEWKMAQEPMDSAIRQVDLASRDGQAAHSLMLRFAKEVAAATGVPVAIVPGPVGGSSLLSNWLPPAGDPTNRGNLYGSLVHRIRIQGYAHPIRGLLWFQGEADVGNTTSLFEAVLDLFVDTLRTDLASPDLFIGICQLGTFEGVELDDLVAIQEAQRRQGANDPGSALVATLDQPRNDFVHFTVEGYKTIGTRLANAVLTESYGVPRPLGPRVVSVGLAPGNMVTVTYDKDLSAVSGLDPNLWRVRDQAGALTILGVVIAGPEVTLHLTSPPRGGTTVSYGYSGLPSANWLRSLDGAGAAAAFRDIPVN